MRNTNGAQCTTNQRITIPYLQSSEKEHVFTEGSSKHLWTFSNTLSSYSMFSNDKAKCKLYSLTRNLTRTLNHLHARNVDFNDVSSKSNPGWWNDLVDELLKVANDVDQLPTFRRALQQPCVGMHTQNLQAKSIAANNGLGESQTGSSKYSINEANPV